MEKSLHNNGLRLFAGASVMGILSDAWLRGTPLGINLSLWILALAIVTVILFPRREAVWRGGTCLCLFGAILFAGAFAWRASPVLHDLDAVALLVCLGLTVPQAQGQNLIRAYLSDYARGVLSTGVQTVGGGFMLVFREIPWRETPHGVPASLLRSVAIGLLIALPLLALFGGLLAAADPVFHHLLQWALDWNLSDLATQLAVIGIGTLIAGGFLRALTYPKPSADTRQPLRWNLNTLEMAITLGLLDLLFLTFVLVQMRYFFGGSQMLHITDGLTYAQYARSGFFELVAVAALVLPMLLTFDSVHHAASAWGERIFRALSGIQILLLLVIMASAIQRMRLYQSAYGLTELRFYTTAFMAWLAVVFLWFIGTTLREQRERFAIGALAAALLMIGLLQVLNPDAQIVRANTALAAAGHPFDVDYAASLSDDAVPALVAARAALPLLQSQALTAQLVAHSQKYGHPNWRSWNWSRITASHLLQSLRP
jgi:hypothetical protein